jgi:IMP dehydrogenase
MPISNGDAMTDTTANALDYTKALEILKNEYSERDGIDVKTLIDSKKNGGLTYNDFLMLPGYIGALVSHPVLLQRRAIAVPCALFCSVM